MSTLGHKAHGAVRDLLLGRHAIGARRTEYTYLLLIAIWHATVYFGTLHFIDWWLGYGSAHGRFQPGPIRPPFDWARVAASLHPLILGSLLLIFLLEGVLGALIFQPANRRRAWRLPGACRAGAPSVPDAVPRVRSESSGRMLDARVHIRTWWRACLYTTVLLPVLALGLAETHYSIGLVGTLFLFPLVLTVLPAWLVRDELPPRRRSRWRPQCPECGYSIRRLTEPRCPECGVSFPTPAVTFRRWAVQRMPWDRARRGGRLFAYLRTLAAIVFTPGRAARRIALPDRWFRAAAWAVVHLLLAATMLVLLSHEQLHLRRAVDLFIPAPGRLPPALDPADAPPGRIALWATQAGAAWSATLAALPAIGAGVSLLIPGRHRAARRCGVKWSLYLTPVILMSILTWYGYYAVFPPGTPSWLSSRGGPAPPDPAQWLCVATFGTWWAIGLSASLYGGSRWRARLLLYLAAFLATWLLATRVLFAAGPLEMLR